MRHQLTYKALIWASGSTIGTVGFRITAPFGGENRLDESSTYHVPITSLDSYLTINPLAAPLSLLKIDVEGAELEVLKGAKRLLLESPIALAMIENSRLDDIEAFLAEIEWRCFAIDKDGEIRTSRAKKHRAYNLLACGPAHPLWAKVALQR